MDGWTHKLVDDDRTGSGRRRASSTLTLLLLLFGELFGCRGRSRLPPPFGGGRLAPTKVGLEYILEDGVDLVRRLALDGDQLLLIAKVREHRLGHIPEVPHPFAHNILGRGGGGGGQSGWVIKARQDEAGSWVIHACSMQQHVPPDHPHASPAVRR